MLMNIHLREAKASDMPLVKKMAVETSWECVPETQEKLLDREKWSVNVIDYYENVLKGENSEVFIAEDERHGYVGHLIVGQSRGTITGLSFGHVYDVFVEEEFRGKGIGKLLLEKAGDYCRKKGHSRIALSVLATNDSAIKLYSRTGYKPERITTEKNDNLTVVSWDLGWGKVLSPKSPKPSTLLYYFLWRLSDGRTRTDAAAASPTFNIKFVLSGQK
jgi:ribosomal protein S18 acetylase RimI-like enzyme